MNMSMRNIINNNQSRENNSRNHSIQRRQFGFRNGYNYREQSQTSQTSHTSQRSQTSESHQSNTNNRNLEVSHTQPVLPAPSTFYYNLFQRSIDICANNLTSELLNDSANNRVLQNNYNRYYSTFDYDSLSIRFFHNEILNLDNINDAIENVIQNINNREIQNLLDDFHDMDENETSEFINSALYNERATINSQETIAKINNNITHGEYVHYSSCMKNDVCPILLAEFKDDDIISMFNLCNHAIHESTCEKYVQTFTKCPLCNHKLFEL